MHHQASTVQDASMWPRVISPRMSYQSFNECCCRVVEGGSKRRRGGIVAAVENGGAHWCISEGGEDIGDSRYLAQLRREAQECDPTWSFGEKFVGAC